MTKLVCREVIGWWSIHQGWFEEMLENEGSELLKDFWKKEFRVLSTIFNYKIDLIRDKMRWTSKKMSSRFMKFPKSRIETATEIFKFKESVVKYHKRYTQLLGPIFRYIEDKVIIYWDKVERSEDYFNRKQRYKQDKQKDKNSCWE